MSIIIGVILALMTGVAAVVIKFEKPWSVRNVLNARSDLASRSHRFLA